MAPMASRVRAHASGSRGNAPSEGGMPGVLGVRREDKNKWERRAPIAPRHVAELVKQGIKVIVQPSTRRVFSDVEYVEAGAVIQEELSECCAIVAVKEVPIDLMLANRTWMFFSHTIKAQPTGMPLLQAALERKVRLVDYECITGTGRRGDPRLVAFGAYAGYAGAIDFLRGLGERLLALGFSTPLLHIGSAFMYPSLEEAKRAVALAGEAIKKNGFPAALCPFTACFTGQGKVSCGALEIFKLLPHSMVAPNELHQICAEENADRNRLFLTVTTAEHMVRRCDGAPFDKSYYYQEPDHHESIFQDNILPYCTAIVNGMYWDARFPRLFTHQDLSSHVRAGSDKLLGVCDITCDADGSVPTRQFTSIEQPFFIYNAMSEQTSDSLDEPGVLFHAVDHLPSELPREASEHFGDCLLQFLPALSSGRAPDVPNPNGAGTDIDLPVQMRGAIIAEGGELTKDFKYIHQLAKVNEAAVIEVDAPEFHDLQHHQHGAHASQAAPACETLELTGHLFDTRMINNVCDLTEKANCRLKVLHIDVGSMVTEMSSASVLLMAQSEKQLAGLVAEVKAAAAKVNIVVREGGTRGLASVEPPVAVSKESQRSVLLLGSGMVCGPLVEYLLRRPENIITVASLVKTELDGLVHRHGGERIKPQILDVASDEAAHLREQLVISSDLVVSLVPATLHASIARLAIQHRKHMVTASYVSPEMQSLDAEAREAGVLIINEVGLDPGIDHMSAMKMIHHAQSGGGQIIKFSSLCGGLPAPEAAGSSPLGYKFSWSPKGVLTASRNAACYKEDGKIHEVPGEDLLASSKPFTLNNAFALDVLPNRDSTSFAELYGLAEAPSFFRGTFRYRGFCERMLAVAQLGLLQQGPLDALSSVDLSAPSWQWLACVLGCSSDSAEAVKSEIRKRLGSGVSATSGLEFVTWLGLLSDAPLPVDAIKESPVDVVALLLQRDELAYQPGERDMVIMIHELLVKTATGAVEKHTATLIEYGEPRGDTAMARTVGLPAAMAAQLVLDKGSEPFGVGVQRPLRPEWYEPILKLLDGEGIRLTEQVEQLQVASVSEDELEAGAASSAVVATSRL